MDYITRMFQPPEDVEAPVLADAEKPYRYLTWKEYVSVVKRIAVGLGSLGVANQDCIALLSNNDIYYYVLGDAAIATGGIFTGIPTYSNQQDLARAISIAEVKWLFVEEEFLNLAFAAVEAVGLSKQNVLVFDPPGSKPFKGLQKSFRHLLLSDENLFRNINEGKDPEKQIAHRIFTSGSTGPIKAVELSHGTNIRRLARGVSVATVFERKTLYMISMYHASGQGICMNALAGDGPVYISRTSLAGDGAAMLDLIKSLETPNVLLSARMLEAVIATINSGNRQRKTLHSLKRVIITGSLCRTEVGHDFRSLLQDNTLVLMLYGSTECGLISAGLVDSEWASGCVGATIPGVEVRIVDCETLQDVSDEGISGEICVRSNLLFSQYCNNPTATEACFLPGKEGWFRTGDRGYLKATGKVEPKQLIVIARTKEIFKVQQKEVYATAIEAELRAFSEISDAHVTSTPARDGKGFECMAYVVQKSGSILKAQQVVDRIAACMSAHEAPTGAVVFCDRIPRGSMLKVIASQLEQVQTLPESAKFLSMPQDTCL